MRTVHRPLSLPPRGGTRRAALLACSLAAAASCDGGPTQQPAGEVPAIVFCRGGEFSCRLTAVNPDGSGARPLSPHSAADPAWSPDGRRIAFIGGQDQNPELYVWNTDGSTRRLTHTQARSELSPAWSPDGTRIVFAAAQSHRVELFVIGADGTGERELSTGQGQAWRPDWSPDGRSIAFEAHRQVAVLPADGGEVRILADGEAPAWSPDGTRIAFSRRGQTPSGAEERAIFTMAPDGTALVRVTAGPHDTEPDWSPDGRRIVFTRGAGRLELHVVNADGGGHAVLAADSARNVSPSWRP